MRVFVRWLVVAAAICAVIVGAHLITLIAN